MFAESIVAKSGEVYASDAVQLRLEEIVGNINQKVSSHISKKLLNNSSSLQKERRDKN